MIDVGYAVSRAARRYASRVAITFQGRDLTYAELDAETNQLARALLGLGLAKGDRVALILRNCPEFVAADFALAKTGLVKVSLNFRNSVEEHLSILGRAGARAAIVGAEFAEALAADLPALPELRHLVRVGSSAGPGIAYETLIATQSSSEPGVAVVADDLCEIRYTSGSTGVPKGAMITHRCRLAQTLNVLTDRLPILPSAVMLHSGSLAYASGVYFLPHFLRGARNVILGRFDAEQVLDAIARERVTTMSMVPTMISLLLGHPAVSRRDHKSLRAVYYGGAPMPLAKLAEALELFGPVFGQTYGLTEAPMSVYLSVEDHVRAFETGEQAALRTVGREITSARIRVVGADGEPCRAGEVGEVAIQGPHVMSGYWQTPDETAKTLRDGWLLSGDVGMLDDRGYLTLVDRKGDKIITGGFNVYPSEVESVLYRHPAVLEAAVIGTPDTVWGDIIEAIVVPKPGVHLTDQELVEHCRKHLAEFKKPRAVRFVRELPKGATGKISRRWLREHRTELPSLEAPSHG